MFACEKDELSDHHIRCLNSNQVCNGKPQCPHGDDEGKKEKYFIFLPPSVFFNVGQICEENNQQFLYQGNEPSLKILTNRTITNISYIRRTISQNTNKSEDPSLTVLKIQENHN